MGESWGVGQGQVTKASWHFRAIQCPSAHHFQKGVSRSLLDSAAHGSWSPICPSVVQAGSSLLLGTLNPACLHPSSSATNTCGMTALSWALPWPLGPPGGQPGQQWGAPMGSIFLGKALKNPKDHGKLEGTLGGQSAILPLGADHSVMWLPRHTAVLASFPDSPSSGLSPHVTCVSLRVVSS